MDVIQQKLKMLLEQTDVAFDECKNHPNNEECALAYEDAQGALAQFINKMHVDIKSRYK